MVVYLYWCRAYKLGKKRWSYNQCELVLYQEGSDSASGVTVVEAMHSHNSETAAAGDSSIYGSQVRLLCAHTVICHMHL